MVKFMDVYVLEKIFFFFILILIKFYIYIRYGGAAIRQSFCVPVLTERAGAVAGVGRRLTHRTASTA